MLLSDHQQGCGLETVLRHLSYAPQRWESTGTPVRRYVCLQGALALFLAARACDGRLSMKDREKAKQLVLKMGPENAAMAGLSADWGEDAGNLVKQFEKTDSDIACARSNSVFINN